MNKHRIFSDTDPANPAHFAAGLAAVVVANHGALCTTQPDWWQAVLIELHDQLAETYLPAMGYGVRYHTLIERRVLATWLEDQARQYRINPEGLSA